MPAPAAAKEISKKEIAKCHQINYIIFIMKSAMFYWDWKSQAPLGEMMQAASQIRNGKLWMVNDGSDTYCAILAPNKTEAKACWEKDNAVWLKDEWKQFLEDEKKAGISRAALAKHRKAFEGNYFPEIIRWPKDLNP